MKTLGDYLGFAFRLLAVVVITTLGSLLLGIWIDQQAGTSPWGVLAFMLLGIPLSTFLVYRLSNFQNSKDRQG